MMKGHSPLCPDCNEVHEVLMRAGEMAKGLSDLFFHMANNRLSLPESNDMLFSFVTQLEFIGNTCNAASNVMSGRKSETSIN